MIQQLMLNGLIAGSIYALVALGFTIIYRTVHFFHFAHGVVYTAGAYLAKELKRIGACLLTKRFYLDTYNEYLYIILPRRNSDTIALQ